MRLSAKAITTFNGINSFVLGTQWQIRAGEPNTLYFQLVDLDQANLRYIPNAGATMVVTFPSIDDSAVINVNASQVDAADGSLWSVNLTALQAPFSGNVVFALTEGSVTRRFSVLNAISVEYPTNNGSC
jgi:hypothetical protein